jgi:ankyrin repeat protein
MTGNQLWVAACGGDAAAVSSLLSTQGAQSFIIYRDAIGSTPLHAAAGNRHEAVTKLLIAARCNVVTDLRTEEHGYTPSIKDVPLDV